MRHHKPWRYQQEPPVDPARKRTPTCARCGGRIVFVTSAKNPERQIPCQPEWEYGDRKKTLVVVDERLRGHMMVKAPPDVRGRQPHFGRVCQAEEPAPAQPANPSLWLFKSAGGDS